VCQQGYIEVKAEAAGASTMLAQIVALLERAQGEKTLSQTTIERFVQWYTPAVSSPLATRTRARAYTHTHTHTHAHTHTHIRTHLHTDSLTCFAPSLTGSLTDAQTDARTLDAGHPVCCHFRHCLRDDRHKPFRRQLCRKRPCGADSRVPVRPRSGRAVASGVWHGDCCQGGRCCQVPAGV